MLCHGCGEDRATDDWGIWGGARGHCAGSVAAGESLNLVSAPLFQIH